MSLGLVRYESIIPLIKTCTKIEACNTAQISHILGDIVHKINQNNSVDLWIKMLMYGLNKNCSKISTDLLYEIQLILSNHIHVPTQMKHSMSLLRIPHNLHIYILALLENEDLNPLTMACTQLNIFNMIYNNRSEYDDGAGNDNKALCLLTIYKKLKQLNPAQLSKCMKKLPKLFENNSSFHVFISILLAAFSKYHCEISAILFDEILSILPNPTKTESVQNPENPENSQKIPISLVEIPKDIQIYVCTFLPVKDLIHFEISCRSLCVVARNPNCVISINVRIPTQNIYFMHQRFGKIKNLKCLLYVNASINQFNQKWCRSVTNLSMIPIMMPSDGISIFNTFLSKIIIFDRLETCALWYNCTMKLFINNQINYNTLKVLILGEFNFNKEILKAIIGCVNLESLSLESVTIDDDENINNDPMLSQLKQLNRIKHFKTDTITIRQLFNFVKWILNGNKKKKVLTVLCKCNSNVKLFELMGANTLQNLEEIKLRFYGSNEPGSVLSDIGNAMKIMNKTYGTKLENIGVNVFKIGFDPKMSQWKDTFNKMGIISSLCNFTSLSADFRGQTVDMNEFVSLLINAKQKLFSKFKIYIRFFTDSDIEPNANDTDNDLQIKSQKIATQFIEAYDAKLKPFLRITTQIMKQIGISQIETSITHGLIWRRLCGKQYISDIQQTIKQNCDDACIVERYGLSMRLTWQSCLQ